MTSDLYSIDMHQMTSTPQGEARTPVSRIASSAGSTSDYISPTTKRKRNPLASQSSILTDVPDNDDAAEKRQRRHSRVMDMKRLMQSPCSSPSDRRRSLPLSGLSSGQLTEHYSNCIKLSAENKINSKNAFGLHLIDYMAELLKSKQGEMTNFQVASCTLDASAKIYAGRVDAIHAETYKMLGGLGHDRQSKHSEGDGLDGCDDPGSQDKQKKKRVRHSNTLETNLKNINVTKLDLGFEPDPLFQRTSAAFDEGGSFGLLLNHLHCRDDGCELLLDSNTVLSPEGEATKSDIGTQTTVDMSDVREIYAGVSLDNLQICPEFATFEFTNWNDDCEERASSMLTKTASSSAQAFDVAAIPEPLEETTDHAGMDVMGGGDPIEGGFSDDDGDCDAPMDQPSMFISDNSATTTTTVGRSGCSSVSVNTGGSLCLQLSLAPTEYSYFNMDILNTWAGPQHWKLKPKSKDQAADEGPKKAKSKKPLFRINYDEQINFENSFSESKAATTLSQATLNKYKKSELTLPDHDNDYKPASLFQMFLRPTFMVKRQMNSEGNDLIDDGIEGYDYNNENDCANFCPAAGGDDDDDYSSQAPGSVTYDFASSGGIDLSQTSAGSHSGFLNNSILDATLLTGDKLVAQPHKVNKIDIQYARTAKRMDVKKLKTHMWNFLTTHHDEDDKENISQEAEKSDGVAGSQSFCDMYSILPERLSKTMSKNLSVPIAFVCLLHLCNEKSLLVSNSDHLDDLIISQD
ncbi:condensin complex subunit 2-like isoform X1 [Diadema antillarum]|uniref:condensin complex subunit 2-like isoform X1 n=2 Tax=Diadema antillarum TaxID=105358 RepID=UPI003A88948E